MSTAGRALDVVATLLGGTLLAPVLALTTVVTAGFAYLLASLLLPTAGAVGVGLLATAAPLAAIAYARATALRTGVVEIAAYVVAIQWLSLGVVIAGGTVVGVLVGAVAGGVAGFHAFAVAGLAVWVLAVTVPPLALRSVASGTERGLQLRMTAAVLLLALLTVAVCATLWIALFLPLLGTDSVRIAVGVASLGTTLFAGSLVHAELRQVASIEDHAGASVVTAEEMPHLHATVARVASQLGVPMPAIALSRRDAPEAMIVGFRPGNMHLVLSTGAIRALGDDEIEAVVAHELAHVANGDAMVTTAVSVPVVLAEDIRAGLDGGERLYGGFAAVGQLLVSMLSRARELAADRTAARLTGAPGTLASALRTLDDRLAETPRRDLRSDGGLSALSILPLEPDELERVSLDGGSDDPAPLEALESRYARFRHRLFRTHPPTSERLEAIARVELEDE